MKKQRGITLIALIITIIVMLILIAVTVTTAINGGLFENTKKASKDTQKQSVLEELNSLTAEFNADLYANPDKYYYEDEADFRKFIIEQTRIRILGENNENLNSKIGDFTAGEEEGVPYYAISFVYKGISAKWKFVINPEEETIDYIELVLNGITIQEIGDAPIVTTGENIKAVTEDGVPIPKGFYYVTGTKNTGVVIIDNQEDENKADGNNGNQFVWVPVKLNPKLKIVIDDTKKISKVTIMDLQGYKKEINVNGTYLEKTVNLNGNSIYEVAIEYEDGTKEERFFVARLEYIRESQKIYAIEYLGTENGELEGIADYYISNNKEESFEFKIDAFKKMFNEEEIYDTTDDTPEKESVLKYGGFYIGRYEIGADGTTKKGNSLRGGSISFVEAKTEAKAKYNNNEFGVKSTLPSGAAWYGIEKWFIESDTISWKDVFFDSTSWGNYKQSRTEQGIPQKTGSREEYSKKNIYDLAGNLEEWTTEMDSDGKEIKRGGSYEDYPTSQITSYPHMSSKSVNSDNEETGYRLMLYIKE